MAAKTFWQWYDKELPRGDDASNFQAAWDASVEEIKAEIATLENSLTRAINRNDIAAVHLILKDMRQLIGLDF
jgi:hypothetical protein